MVGKQSESKKTGDKMINYFAYGSNMDKEDLDKWYKNRGLPEVKFLSISPAKLNGYKLSFNYFSNTRGGGAANIMKSKKDCVYGLLTEIRERDLEIIRDKEGCPDFYDEICVDVEKFDGTMVRDVKTYKVVKVKEKPSHQPPIRYYMGLIIKNAKKYDFPIGYVKFLESVKTKD
jgi:hypothetical protein